jgi:hypothetical protein
MIPIQNSKYHHKRPPHLQTPNKDCLSQIRDINQQLKNLANACLMLDEQTFSLREIERNLELMNSIVS